jgi:hypothetical protein
LEVSVCHCYIFRCDAPSFNKAIDFYKYWAALPLVLRKRVNTKLI